jgi:hypothetical protein
MRIWVESEATADEDAPTEVATRLKVRRPPLSLARLPALAAIRMEVARAAEVPAWEPTLAAAWIEVERVDVSEAMPLALAAARMEVVSPAVGDATAWMLAAGVIEVWRTGMALAMALEVLARRAVPFREEEATAPTDAANEAAGFVAPSNCTWLNCEKLNVP